METKKLKQIALDLQVKINTGLQKDNTEIQCLPTYIIPKSISEFNGKKALVLDLCGTNYRVATIDFIDGQPAIHPENGFKIDLANDMKALGFTVTSPPLGL